MPRQYDRRRQQGQMSEIPPRTISRLGRANAKVTLISTHAGSRTMRLALTLLGCLLASMAHAAASKRPHVLIVMTDDQGLGDFSYAGSPVLKTPQLDALA